MRLAGTFSCSLSVGAGAWLPLAAVGDVDMSSGTEQHARSEGANRVLPLGIFQLESVSQYNLIGESETGTLKAIKCL